MKAFKQLPHTADAKFQASGETVEQAYSNAALAMFSLITDTGKVGIKMTRTIEITAQDMESLLYDWLEKLIIMLDSERFLLCRADVEEIKIVPEGCSLRATVFGDTDMEKYEVHGTIKAVTYNDMKIDKRRDGWQVTVVVDT